VPVQNNSPKKGFFNFRYIMAKFGTYIQEAYDELVHKVTWPTWDELQKTTWVVILGLIIITLLIFGYDAICEALMNFIYSLA